MTPAKVQPALLGGVTIGVLSALPFVMVGNCCCCAWILLGGGLSSYLMQQNHPEPIDVGDGAVVGLMAGAFGAVVWLVVSASINTFMAPMQSGLVQQVLRDSTNLPPAMRDILESAQSAPVVGLGMVFSFLVMLTVTTMFGMLGGIFGALLFRKNQQPVVPPPIPQ
jgi:hypothetical protein